MLKTLLVIALVATLAVLAAGMVAMVRGGEFNKKYGNKLMRARVAAQAVAIAILLALFMVGGE
ncbi:MAG: twin transmembrane helix small protein [Proteobacteria bacterium]|nr:twin transmembrane helix small protein [Pseudomonadota bacterium]